MNKNKRAILLTACVNPNGMIFTKIQNIQDRINQYKNSLRWYLHNTSLKIVFVENTQYDFSKEFSEYITSGRLEYITFDGNNYDRSLGKGYGEALIIKTALAKSQIISECDVIIKVTGRLIISNINRIIKEVKFYNTVYANTNIRNGHALCGSVIFVASKDFLENYLTRDISRLNDSLGYYFEHLLYDSMIKWIKSGGMHSDFKNPIKIDGVSGSTGEEYMKSKKFIGIKAYLKYIAHRHGLYINNYNSNERKG